MKIAIVSEDRQLLREVQSIFAKTTHDIVLAPEKSTELRSIAKELAPNLLLIDARAGQAADLDSVEQMTLHCPGIAVVLLSDIHSAEFLLRAMRAGVHEVLPAIEPAHLLIAAVERVAAKHAAAQSANHGKIHAFIGTSGGSGTTFLATNFGYQLAQSQKVLLIDLNLQFGDALSFVQDGKATRSISDLSRDIKRLDESLLQASAIKVTPNYSILAAPDEPGQAADILPEHIDAILKLAVTQYDIVLLDLPRVIDARLIKALDQATSIFLVLQASVPHLRNADRLVSAFRALEYPREKIELVVNRFDKRSEITLDKIRNALGPFEMHTIANGYRQVSTAINQGVPLVQLERKHGVIRSLTELRNTVTPPLASPNGLFQRLFRRA
jgi:pilus assembly protein CpaE